MSKINNIQGIKNEAKKTVKKAEFMAKDMADDVRDNFQGAVNIVENKADELLDKYEQKKFSYDLKKQMKNEYK